MKFPHKLSRLIVRGHRYYWQWKGRFGWVQVGCQNPDGMLTYLVPGTDFTLDYKTGQFTFVNTDKKIVSVTASPGFPFDIRRERRRWRRRFRAKAA